MTCYDTQEPGTATTIDVTAGQQMGIMSDGTIYHPGVVNVYMAKAPDSVDGFTGADGDVWFKVYEITAETNGGESITFPAQSKFPWLSLLSFRSLALLTMIPILTTIDQTSPVSPSRSPPRSRLANTSSEWRLLRCMPPPPSVVLSSTSPVGRST